MSIILDAIYVLEPRVQINEAAYDRISALKTGMECAEQTARRVLRNEFAALEAENKRLREAHSRINDIATAEMCAKLKGEPGMQNPSAISTIQGIANGAIAGEGGEK